MSCSCAEQIHEGLYRAVMTMKKGEEAIVKISSDFLNSAASLLYEIKLIDFEKVQFSYMLQKLVNFIKNRSFFDTKMVRIYRRSRSGRWIRKND